MQSCSVAAAKRATVGQVGGVDDVEAAAVGPGRHSPVDEQVGVHVHPETLRDEHADGGGPAPAPASAYRRQDSAMPDDDVPTPVSRPPSPTGFDRLLRGAIDLHVHGGPIVARSARPRQRPEVPRLARAYGMPGWALKSHLWATMDRARSLGSRWPDTGFTVHGSITLNPPARRPEPAVVELAAAHGARVVFLPTSGFRRRPRPRRIHPHAAGPHRAVLLRYAAPHTIALCEPDDACPGPRGW